jgi:hypothetical protein
LNEASEVVEVEAVVAVVEQEEVNDDDDDMDLERYHPLSILDMD